MCQESQTFACTMSDGWEGMLQRIVIVQILTPTNVNPNLSISWCGHCKTLAPIYDQLGDAFSHAKDKVIIAKIDTDIHKEIGNKFSKFENFGEEVGGVGGGWGELKGIENREMNGTRWEISD